MISPIGNNVDHFQRLATVNTQPLHFGYAKTIGAQDARKNEINLFNYFLSNPLIDPDLSIINCTDRFINVIAPTPDSRAKRPARTALWVPTGLAIEGSDKNMSAGVTVGLLIYLCTAEDVRKKLNLTNVIVDVGTDEAKSLFQSPQEKAKVTRLANQTRSMLLNLIRYFGLQDHYKVILSSDNKSDPLYKKLASDTENKLAKNFRHCFSSDPRMAKLQMGYVARQAAWTEYWREKENVTARLAWSVGYDPLRIKWNDDPGSPYPQPTEKLKTHNPLSEEITGWDEQVFDRFYEALFPESDYSKIYCVAERTLNPLKTKACPYTVSEGEKDIRLLLTDDEKQIREKIEKLAALAVKARVDERKSQISVNRVFNPGSPDGDGVKPTYAANVLKQLEDIINAFYAAFDPRLAAFRAFQKAYAPYRGKNPAYDDFTRSFEDSYRSFARDNQRPEPIKLCGRDDRGLFTVKTDDMIQHLVKICRICQTGQEEPSYEGWYSAHPEDATLLLTIQPDKREPYTISELGRFYSALQHHDNGNTLKNRQHDFIEKLPPKLTLQMLAELALREMQGDKTCKALHSKISGQRRFNLRRQRRLQERQRHP